MFAIDIDTCQRCGGHLKVLASIEDPERCLAEEARWLKAQFFGRSSVVTAAFVPILIFGAYLWWLRQGRLRRKLSPRLWRQTFTRARPLTTEMWLMSLHDGTAAGTAGRLIVTLTGIVPLVLLWSGFRMWLRARARAASAIRAELR